MRAAGRGRRRKISSLRLYVSLWSVLPLRNQKQGKFTMRRRGEEKQGEKAKKEFLPSLRLYVSLWPVLSLCNQKQGKLTKRRRGEEKQGEKTKNLFLLFASTPLRLFLNFSC